MLLIFHMSKIMYVASNSSVKIPVPVEGDFSKDYWKGRNCWWAAFLLFAHRFQPFQSKISSFELFILLFANVFKSVILLLEEDLRRFLYKSFTESEYRHIKCCWKPFLWVIGCSVLHLQGRRLLWGLWFHYFQTLVLQKGVWYTSCDAKLSIQVGRQHKWW